MDELEISGKRYISTRRAAREHGYHSDYMGQLIRAKKVAGQKVGRAWYIEEQSLAAYLGKEPQPAEKPVQPEPQVQPEKEIQNQEPAPIERLVIDEPEEVAPAPEILAPEEISAPEPVEIKKITEPHVAEPQKIYHAPHIHIEEQEETRIPIHTPIQKAQEVGGLRYAADDSPSIPVVAYAQQRQTHMAIPQPPAVRATKAGRFPYIGLSVVGIMAILAATFASNFISATIVTEEGKAATVQYAIHW